MLPPLTAPGASARVVREAGPIDVLVAAYLCSSAADCFVGQVFPVSGGWAVR